MSKQQQGKSTNKKVPQSGNIQSDSPATKLLEKRRQMYEIHEKFDAEQIEFKKKEELFRQQEQEIKEQDIKIQMNLIEVCKFLQDNENKKLRSEKRRAEEEKIREQKEEEIKKIQIEIAKYETHQKSLEKRVQALKKYEEYLDRVIKEHGDQYSDLGEILNRYKTLSQSNENLVQEHDDLERKQEQLKHFSTTFAKDKQSQILQLSNDIKDLAKKLEEKKAEKQKLQENLEKSNQESSNKNLDLGRILMAIDNIYNRCNEGMMKVKQEQAENGKNQNKLDGKDKKGDKKGGKDQKKSKQQQQQAEGHPDNEDNFEEKSKKAEIKLEKIKNFMVDFKSILDSCKYEVMMQQQQQIQQQKR